MLAAVPSAVGCARLFVRYVLAHWGLPHLVETAELLTSELATNAVKTAGAIRPAGQDIPLDEVTLIQVRLILVADSLFIGMWDRVADPPVLQQPSLDAEGGRGLFLVDCISNAWGCHRPRTGGKIVWCELDTTPPTTASGLPIRMSIRIPAQRVEATDDIELLGRVLKSLRRL
jgi:anti-sigma regulatory factor (Ser/Thr protein kinase)